MSSAKGLPFDDLAEAPLGEEFLAYMDKFGKGSGRYTGIKQWIQDELNSKNDRILAPFTLVASGCFNRGGTDAHVAKYVVDRLDTIHHIRDTEIQSEIASGIQSQLEDIDSNTGRWDWLHGHRKNIHFKFSEAGWSVVRSLVGLSEVAEGYDDLAVYFDDRIDSEDDPFYALFNDVKSIPDFGRLSAFNFLEITDTAGNIDGLYPQAYRADYIRTANPKPGFFYVFLADGPEDDRVAGMEWDEAADELGVDDDGLDALVTLLCEAAKDTLDWSEEYVMYDVESCLCIFAKKPKNRMLELGGDEDDGGTTRSGC